MFRKLFVSASTSAFMFIHMWLGCNGVLWVGDEPGNISVCYGTKATFIWVWNPPSAESSISQINWIYQRTGVNIMTYSPTFTVKDGAYRDRCDYVNSLGNAAMVIENISENDTGRYSISLTANGTTYNSENANLIGTSVEEVTTCFTNFKMMINGKTVEVSNGTTSAIAVTSGSSPKIDLEIPDGCNNEAVCTYGGNSCGRCHPVTNCTFIIENIEEGKSITIKVTPCQGVEYIYLIPVSGTKPGLTDAQIAGIVVGGLILCVIIIVVIVLVLKKKNIICNPISNDGHNAENDITKTEAQKNTKKA